MGGGFVLGRRLVLLAARGGLHGQSQELMADRAVPRQMAIPGGGRQMGAEQSARLVPSGRRHEPPPGGRVPWIPGYPPNVTASRCGGLRRLGGVASGVRWEGLRNGRVGVGACEAREGAYGARSPWIRASGPERAAGGSVRAVWSLRGDPRAGGPGVRMREWSVSSFGRAEPVRTRARVRRPGLSYLLRS